MKEKKDLQDLVETADHERVEAYMTVLDRILLYRLANKLMPTEDLAQSVNLWSIIIKKGIDMDVVKRTNFLEDTTLGRATKFQKEMDGEEYRLHCLKQLDIAKQVLEHNIPTKEPEWGEDGYEDESSDPMS